MSDARVETGGYLRFAPGMRAVLTVGEDRRWGTILAAKKSASHASYVYLFGAADGTVVAVVDDELQSPDAALDAMPVYW